MRYCTLQERDKERNPLYEGRQSSRGRLLRFQPELQFGEPPLNRPDTIIHLKGQDRQEMSEIEHLNKNVYNV